MLRKRAAAAAAAAALAVALYGGYWWLAADRLRDGLDAWAAEQRARGWTVELGRVSVGGFPSRLALALERPRLVAPPAAGGWTWQGPRVLASTPPWRLGRIEVAAPGLHSVSPAPGPGAPLIVRAERADGVLEGLETGTARRITAQLETVSIGVGADGPRQTVERIEVAIALPPAPGRADLATGPAPEPEGPRITLRLSGIDLAAAPARALGRRIEAAALEAKLIGPLPHGPPVRALAVWRDGGGTIEVRRLHLLWRRLAVEAEGTLALDDEMQPIGALRAEVRGYGVLIDALVEAGTLGTEGAGALRIALGLLARTASDASGRIAIPVTIQDRALSIGPVKAATLPRIDWPRGVR